MFMIDVTGVRPLGGHRLELTFSDGLSAVVDMDRVIEAYTGICAPLQEDSFFRQVRTDHELGTIVWPNGADVCPDVLYSYASGRPIFVNGDE